VFWVLLAIATCIKTNQKAKERGGAPRRLSLLPFDWCWENLPVQYKRLRLLKILKACE